MGEQRQPPDAHAAALTPGTYAKAMTLPMAPAIATEIALTYHVILEALRGGHCNEDHLASMMQVTMKTMLIANRGHIKLDHEVLRNAQQGIVRCRRTGLQTGIWKLDPSTYKTLCEVLATFDRLLATTPFYEFMLASENLNELIVHCQLQRRDVTVEIPAGSGGAKRI
jgi:hypothetical protein